MIESVLKTQEKIVSTMKVESVVRRRMKQVWQNGISRSKAAASNEVYHLVRSTEGDKFKKVEVDKAIHLCTIDPIDSESFRHKTGARFLAAQTYGMSIAMLTTKKI